MLALLCFASLYSAIFGVYQGNVVLYSDPNNPTLFNLDWDVCATKSPNGELLGEIRITLKSNALGWMGMNFDSIGGSAHKDKDMILAWVNPITGEARAVDAYSLRNCPNRNLCNFPDVALNGTDDLFNISGGIVDGYAQVTFRRKLVTKDLYDEKVKRGAVSIQWAFAEVPFVNISDAANANYIHFPECLTSPVCMEAINSSFRTNLSGNMRSSNKPLVFFSEDPPPCPASPPPPAQPPQPAPEEPSSTTSITTGDFNSTGTVSSTSGATTGDNSTGTFTTGAVSTGDNTTGADTTTGAVTTGAASTGGSSTGVTTSTTGETTSTTGTIAPQPAQFQPNSIPSPNQSDAPISFDTLWQGLPIYAWAAIGGGILLVLIVIIVIIVVARKKSKATKFEIWQE